jgi:hypothetical protein
MNYSTLIHSSLVNPSHPKLKENEQDPIDTVTLDVPLLTRLLELAREDIKSDAELHNVLTRILTLKNQGTLGMNHYDEILGKSADKDSAELESIRKLAGI